MRRATIVLTVMLLAIVIAPTVAQAHALNGTLSGRYPAKVEVHRPRVIYWLKRYKVYSPARVGRILNIIRHESGGNPKARNGSHRGLVQFTSSWKHNYSRAYFKKHGIRDYQSDNRMSADWSIRRIVKVYKDGGVRKVKQHWKATYWR